MANSHPQGSELLGRRSECEALSAGLAREHLPGLGDSDPVSEDLVINLIEELEKHRWMLLPEPDLMPEHTGAMRTPLGNEHTSAA
jgi:hypothetical protein